MKEWSEMNQNLEEKPERRTFGEFVKDHKKQLMIGVTATGLVVVGVVIFKKKDIFKTFFTSDVAPTIAEDLDNIRPISDSFIGNNIKVIPECSFSNVNVKGFIRNLPAGQKASPGKQEFAKQFNICLGENQTLVSPFIRRIKSNQYVA